MTATEIDRQQTLSPAEAEKLGEFLEMVQEGVGHLNAAIACGWTPHRLNELMQDPDFSLLVRYATERRLEDTEAELFKLVRKGHFPAIQMVLYCQGSDRGWRPPAQRLAINHGGTVQVERVVAVREALGQLLQENGGVEMLAAGGALGEIVDADVVED